MKKEVKKTNKRKNSPSKKTTKKVVKDSLKKRGKKWWRESKFTKEVVGKLVEAFRLDCSDKQASAYAGIHRDTFDRWYHDREGFSDKIGKKKWEEFVAEINCAKEFALMQAHKTITKAIIRWDVKTAIELVKRRDPRYKDKAEVDNNHIIDWIKITLDE